MSTRCMYDGDKAHPPIMLSFSLRFLSPLFFPSFVSRSFSSRLISREKGGANLSNSPRGVAGSCVRFLG